MCFAERGFIFVHHSLTFFAAFSHARHSITNGFRATSFCDPFRCRLEQMLVWVSPVWHTHFRIQRILNAVRILINYVWPIRWRLRDNQRTFVELQLVNEWMILDENVVWLALRQPWLEYDNFISEKFAEILVQGRLIVAEYGNCRTGCEIKICEEKYILETVTKPL